jgi:anti-anti-sigma factor
MDSTNHLVSVGGRADWMLRVAVDESRREVMVCTVVGEVDMTTAPTLAHTLHPQAGRPLHLLVDLSGVRFLGSHGVMVLVQVWQAQHDDYLFALVAPSAAARIVLDVIGLTDIPRYDSLGAAVLAATSGTHRC